MRFVFTTVVAVLIGVTLSYPSEELVVAWNKFKRQHKKSYDNTEEIKRLEIFENNSAKIEDHNKQFEENKVSYKMALNQFADMTQEEYIIQYASGYKYENNVSNNYIVVKNKIASVFEIPDEIDWREKGAVTEVKNQDTCGSCWAFSVTGALEGQNFLKNGQLISLSEQELVDCIVMRKPLGCNGGLVDDGYKYVIKHGLASEADYPYEAADNLCHRGSIPSSVTEIGYARIFGQEEALKEAVATIGPISVTMDASKWEFYSQGIFYEANCQTDPNLLNHAILVVGYGVENGNDYWLVKNSYGPEWGENGYIRLARNANNLCGIATTPSYPIV